MQALMIILEHRLVLEFATTLRAKIAVDLGCYPIHSGFEKCDCASRARNLDSGDLKMGSVSQLKPSSRGDGEVVDTDSEILSTAEHLELRGIIFSRSFRQGNFTLSSGKKSSLYFNMKPTMMDARGAELAARAFIALMVKTQSDYVSGLEMGAVPVIGAMAAIGNLINHPVKSTFVRKRMKEHGTKELIEGLGPDESLSGKTVFVIDDVATSGKSIHQAIEEIRRAGGIVTHAAALVNRHEGGDELLLDHGVKLLEVFSAQEIAENNG